ncbi:MAG: sigma-54 dependent transcriptional regulator [Gammaproteobacteria bacterium]|nr:sigma-54 dependent transcriptional regulator [Gammaproteobacteria bacterium]
MPRILIVDDDTASCRTLQLHLSNRGYAVDLAHSVDEGLAVASRVNPDLLILDIRMPGKSGLEGLPAFKALSDGLHIIMITAFHDMESTIQAMQQGAEDYIHKPIDIDELDAAVDKMIGETSTESQAVATAPREGDSFSMVGRSHAMKEIFKTIGLVAKSPATVLITGESGTGKELVARAIHRNSDKPDGPFVAVNCAALVETLLESDMFGHEKGAFTGAVAKQPGKFSLAQNGAIFLDEVGELSPAMQAKLLRVIQYKEFTPLGAQAPLTSNARIIAASNVTLTERVAEGRFREDLYYRLQVVNIHLPPLRERREDIMDLVQTLLGRINRELRRNVSHITQDVLDRFTAYHWPGNVRELENVLMKAVALSPGDTLSLDLFPSEITGIESAAAKPIALVGGEAELLSLDAMEKRHVGEVLETVGWHRGRACEILGVSRPRLRRMIRQYGLEPPPGVSSDEEDAES